MITKILKYFRNLRSNPQSDMLVENNVSEPIYPEVMKRYNNIYSINIFNYDIYLNVNSDINEFESLTLNNLLCEFSKVYFNTINLVNGELTKYYDRILNKKLKIGHNLYLKRHNPSYNSYLYSIYFNDVEMFTIKFNNNDFTFIIYKKEIFTMFIEYNNNVTIKYNYNFSHTNEKLLIINMIKIMKPLYKLFLLNSPILNERKNKKSNSDNLKAIKLGENIMVELNDAINNIFLKHINI